MRNAYRMLVGKFLGGGTYYEVSDERSVNTIVTDKEITVSVWTLVANMADFGLAMLRYSGRQR